MINHKKIYLLTFFIVFFLCGCISLRNTYVTPTPTKTIARVVLTSTQTITKVVLSLTKTIIIEGTSTSTMQVNVGIFDFCYSKKDPNICISSFHLTKSKTMYMVFFFTNNNKDDSYYLLFDGTKSDCATVAGYPDMYYCLDLPLKMNKSVFVQLFKSAPSSLLAEGHIYINEAYISTPIPTSRPTSKPPDPYSP